MSVGLQSCQRLIYCGISKMFRDSSSIVSITMQEGAAKILISFDCYVLVVVLQVLS